MFVLPITMVMWTNIIIFRSVKSRSFSLSARSIGMSTIDVSNNKFTF